MALDNYLTVTDHNRDVSGMRYIYPVVSRRARGVSVGINLNTNNACNWRCLYCQVPNLVRGSPLPIDVNALEAELRLFLYEALYGQFMQQYVAENDRKLMDIAFSGNGEPTSAKEFPQVLVAVERVLRDFNLLTQPLNSLNSLRSAQPIKVRLITNGSLMDKPSVLNSMRQLARCNGEVWFKLDGGTQGGLAQVNDVVIHPQSHLNRLRKCAEVCPTWIQTCMFALDGEPPGEGEITAYLMLLSEVQTLVHGVLLYGLARPSYQPEASRLGRLPAEWLEALAKRIRALGLTVQVSP